MRRLAPTLALLLISFGCIASEGIPVEERNLVPDAPTAVKIATAVMEAYLGKERFDSYHRIRALRATDDGDSWIVCHCEGIGDEVVYTDHGISVPNVVGLSVVISKKDGAVTYLAPAH